MKQRIIEITEREAFKLFQQNICIYVCTDYNRPEDLNTFKFRQGVKDGRLNFYYQEESNVLFFDEALKFIRRNQAEPIYFFTLLSEQLINLDYFNEYGKF